jgi:dihydroorotate dehydrogenase
MPDWFYRTVTRPVLFRVPATAARSFALGFLGVLARLPLGPSLIDLLGHMRADTRLRCSHLGLTFPTPVGLGPYLDTDAVALPALARFGFGFLEVGPVTLHPSPEGVPVARHPDREALCFSDSLSSAGLKTLGPRIAEASRLGLPVIARLGSAHGVVPTFATEECAKMIADLAPHVRLFSLATLRTAVAEGWTEEDWKVHLRGVVRAARQQLKACSVLLCVPADADDARSRAFIEAARAAGVGGFVVDGGIPLPDDTGEGRLLVGTPAREVALRTVGWLRQHCGEDAVIIASGGVHELEHALGLRAAGADLVQVDSGLVYTGPGLPKRINEALLYLACRQEAENAASDTPEDESLPQERSGEMAWFWTTLMGAGMLAGSVLALGIAATRIVLPYDEQFVGMTRAQLAAVNPRLLPFMAHDRISLAGTMIAVGVLYLGLSWFGIRRGLHWARQAVFASAFTGFASFFLFLGFGYLDPFHAFVTTCLLQLLLLGVHSKLGTYTPALQDDAPALRGGRAWHWSLWGQLLLILHSVALLGAGLVISVIGVTRVFVPEDLHFMHTTADALRAANPQLVPLVAHDRATLGGMLLSSGLAFLLPALWGYRNGARWLWWTFLVAGLSAYAAALGVHLSVGYTDAHHLVPAFAGLTLFLAALGLSYPYLCRKDAANEVAWERFLSKHTGEENRPEAGNREP